MLDKSQGTSLYEKIIYFNTDQAAINHVKDNLKSSPEFLESTKRQLVARRLMREKLAEHSVPSYRLMTPAQMIQELDDINFHIGKDVFCAMLPQCLQETNQIIFKLNRKRDYDGKIQMTSILDNTKSTIYGNGGGLGLNSDQISTTNKSRGLLRLAALFANIGKTESGEALIIKKSVAKTGSSLARLCFFFGIKQKEIPVIFEVD